MQKQKNSLGIRIQNGQVPLESELSKNDFKDLLSEITLSERIKMSFCRVLCFCKAFCGKKREQKVRKMVAERLEKQLDIRSFMSTNTNLSLLLSLLFSETQLLLFKHNKLRTLETGSSDSDDQ